MLFTSQRLDTQGLNSAATHALKDVETRPARLDQLPDSSPLPHTAIKCNIRSCSFS